MVIGRVIKCWFDVTRCSFDVIKCIKCSFDVIKCSFDLIKCHTNAPRSPTGRADRKRSFATSDHGHVHQLESSRPRPPSTCRLENIRRDRSGIAPRSRRDQIAPRSRREYAEIAPRSRRDRAEIAPRSPFLVDSHSARSSEVNVDASPFAAGDFFFCSRRYL